VAEEAALLLGKPMRKLGLRELMFLLEHNVALHLVAPLAVERLQGEPLLQAASHAVDLLTALLETRSDFWAEQYDLWLAVVELLEAAVTQINEAAAKGELGDYLPGFVGDDFLQALMHFRGHFKE
jgi:hypothetical protein